MEEPSLRDSKSFAQGHSAGKGQSQDLNPDLPGAQPELFAGKPRAPADGRQRATFIEPFLLHGLYS